MSKTRAAKRLSLASAGAIAVLLLAFAALGTRPQGVRADDGPQAARKAEFEQMLKKQRERMRPLAKRLLARPEVSENLTDPTGVEKTKVETAKTSLLIAQLNREIAEMALAEYEQGIFVQEKASLEAELKVARDELQRARLRIPEAHDRKAQVKQASKGSAFDLVNEFRFSDAAVIAEFEEKKAGFAVEQIESKLRILLEYMKAKRTKELQSAVEEERSNELASRAGLELEQIRLKRMQNQKDSIANQPVEKTETLEKLEYSRVNLQITEKSAEGSFENAKLTREIAEIAMIEYTEGIFVQDRATLEGEIILAESDVGRARDAIEGTKERLALIKQASNGSVADLSLEFGFADLVADALRRLPRAELAHKQAEAKLKLLVDYTKPKRIKELQVAIEKARLDELSKKAQWQIAQSKLGAIAQAIKALESPAPARKALQPLDRATRDSLKDSLKRARSIEIQIHSKLEQFTKNGRSDNTVQKEVQDLIDQLQAVLDQAEARVSGPTPAVSKTKT